MDDYLIETLMVYLVAGIILKCIRIVKEVSEWK